MAPRFCQHGDEFIADFLGENRQLVERQLF